MSEEPQRPAKKVDEDWKKRAADEKAKIAAAPKPAAVPAAGAPAAGATATPATGASGAAEPPAPAPEEPPAGGRRRGGPFEAMVAMMVQNASMLLGIMPDPMTGERFQDIGQAKMFIDMLATLKAKTKGNLSADEDRFLTQALSELQMEFVALADAMQKQARKGPRA